jgi:hypothetical protein
MIDMSFFPSVKDRQTYTSILAHQKLPVGCLERIDADLLFNTEEQFAADRSIGYRATLWRF